MVTVHDKRYFVKIYSGKQAGGNPCVYYKTGLTFAIIVKWSWYFEYRAALIKVVNPRFKVDLDIKGYDYVEPKQEKEKKMRDKIKGKKATITKFENILKKAKDEWNYLFPIEDDEHYIKAVDKLERLKCELRNLEKEIGIESTTKNVLK